MWERKYLERNRGLQADAFINIMKNVGIAQANDTPKSLSNDTDPKPIITIADHSDECRPDNSG